MATNNVKDYLSEYANSDNTLKKSVAQSALAQYDQAQQNNLNAKNEAYKANEQAKLYNNNLLKTYGLDNQAGAALTQANGNYNTYQNALRQADSDLSTNTNNILSQYASGLSEAEQTQANIDYMNSQTAINNQALGNADYESVAGLINDSASYGEAQKIFDEAVANGTIDLNTYDGKKIEQALALKESSDLSNKYNTTGEVINVYNATTSSFARELSDTSGYGKGGKQDKWVETVLSNAKSGNIPNGTVFDLNVGSGTDLYVYNNGNFYAVKGGKNSISGVIFENSGYFDNNEKTTNKVEKTKNGTK